MDAKTKELLTTIQEYNDVCIEWESLQTDLFNGSPEERVVKRTHSNELYSSIQKLEKTIVVKAYCLFRPQS